VAGVRASGAGGADRRGQKTFDTAVSAMLDEARGSRLADLRKWRGLTQEQVAVRMDVSVARVSPWLNEASTGMVGAWPDPRSRVEQ
jgi:DNA-binding transcriptional regulator YiaG